MYIDTETSPPPDGTFIYNENGFKFRGFNIERAGNDGGIFIRPVLNTETLSWNLSGAHVNGRLLIKAIKEALGES
jgi:hypothetical protein